MMVTADGLRRTGADAVAPMLLGEAGDAHPHVAYLATAAAGEADLADAVHFLCLLHGRYPSVMDHAADRVFHPAARDWMFGAAAGFAAERAYLARLVVAAGPPPSTPGHAQSEAAVQSQSHALAILSQSERRGTALGAAFALVLEWSAVRAVLDGVAQRCGIAAPSRDLPIDTTEVAIRTADQPGVARAVTFGAQQLLLQHRGLWDLLETRSSARADD